MDVSEEELEVQDLTNSDVTTKYRTASDIANKTLGGILSYAKEGQRPIDLCVFGDTLITQQCGAIFKSKKIEKGIAFPTCVSVNEIVCHFSPLASESNASPVFKAGDMVKVDLGVHIDGYIVVAAHTFVIRAEGDTGPVTGRVADVIKAAYLAAEACVKTIKSGVSNGAVTSVIDAVAKDFDVKPVQGVLMHQMKRYVIDGNDVIINREDVEHKVESFEFEDFQVYTVDVFMSTGEGKPTQGDARTTVFKRAVDQNYMLKMKASKYVLSEINKKYPALPFTLRNLDEKQGRFGIVECAKHDLVVPFPVLFEKPGALVAHFKYTVLLLTSGTVKVTGVPMNENDFQSDKVVSDEIQAILASSALKDKKTKKKKVTAMETE